MEKVTIIVPIYNVEKYIEKCVLSIKKQTFKDFKCLLISDGSKDNSLEIAKIIIEDDPRFELIEKSNGGYGSVLEYGIQKTQTDYFMVCDPDDYLDIDCIKRLYEKAKQEDLDIVAGCRYNIFEDSTLVELDDMLEDSDCVLKTKTYITKEDEFFNNFININPAPHSKLYKKELATNIKFTHGVSYTDNMLFYLSVINVNKVAYIEEPLYYYLINRAGNSMNEKEIKALKQHVIVFNEILDQINKTNSDYIYFRLFVSFKEIFYRYGKLNYIDEQLEKDLLNLLEKLLKYKKPIQKYYRKYTNERILANIKDQFILNDSFKEFMYHFWLNQLRKKNEN